ncbi:DALR anticodon-binding domain-containing protein [Thermohalobacter berrensis]|uniref:arginine--tRNA ligase n=1 Tax=Thermohalobacter berrensis TaxID=99594 RepID=A0A419T7E7_9FIRM|nr:DALR anticodon-binding domain-containing protein [Thermohalobacter berrensis]RKD33484.1 hypothetical protein BET03_08850 [Thermohalobacter berrensis]
MKDLIEIFKKSIKKQLETKGIYTNIDFDITVPDNKKHGNLTTNIAFKLAPYEKKAPMDIASLLVENIKRDNLKVSKIDIVKPGFINFFLEEKWIIEIGNIILEKGVNVLSRQGDSYLIDVKLDNSVNNNRKTRAKSFANILKTILEIKGNRVVFNKEEEKDIEKITVTTHINKDYIDPEKKVINIADMILTKDDSIVDKDVEELFTKSEINLWALSKTYSTDVQIPLGSAFINNTDNLFFFIEYPYKRALDVLNIMEREGYSVEKFKTDEMIFNLPQGKDLIFKILGFEESVDKAIEFREPYKVFNFIYEMACLFYNYNNLLQLKSYSEKEIMGNLYILKVFSKFYGELIKSIIDG